MFSLDRWYEVLSTLARAPLRSALTAFAVGWGILMLVLLLGLGRGLQNGAESQFADDAANSVWIFGGSTSQPYQGLPVGRRIVYNNDDYGALRRIDGVEKLTGRYFPGSNGRPFGGDLLVRAGPKSQSFDVRSVHPDHLYLEKTIIKSGRYINQQDISERRKVTVVGVPVAEFLFGTTDVIGRWIEIGGVSFEIVGVFWDDGATDDETRMVYVPITTAQLAWNGGDRIHVLMFTVGDKGVAETNTLIETVKSKLAERQRFSTSDTQATRIRNNLEQYESFQQIFRIMRWFFSAIGACSLFAGVIGVSNIMMITVKERTKEIGIRKALGATPWTIIGTIVQESVFLTALAGYLGLVAGVGFLTLVSKAVQSDYFANPEIDFTFAIWANVILVTSGALAGFIPAWSAARISPVVAMRDA